MRRRLLNFFVRLYPLVWRERYQFEFLGLFEEAEPSWSDISDIARAMIRERAKSAVQSVLGENSSRLRILWLRHLAAMIGSVAFGLAISSVSAAVATLFVAPSKSWPAATSDIHWLYFLPLARVFFTFVGSSVLNWPNSFNFRFAVQRIEFVAWTIFIAGVTLVLACAQVAHGYSPWENLMMPAIQMQMLTMGTTERLADQVERKRLRLEKAREDARAHFKLL